MPDAEDRFMLLSTFAGLLVTVALATGAVAQPSTDINDYVLFATDLLKTKGPTISDGDVGVNDVGGRLLARKYFTGPNSVVASDRVRFDKAPFNTVLETLYANVVEQYGPSPTPFTPPIIADVKAACGFPTPFPTCAPGVDVDVPTGTITTLAPGVYGKVRVHGTQVSSGVLQLSGGGSYVFCDLKVARLAQLQVQDPSTVNVVGRVAFGPSSYLGPDTGSGLAASDIQFYVAGPLVKLTRDSFSNARICAPDSKMRLTQGGTHVGVYVAAYIRTEEVTLSVGSPSGAFL
jgi:hypothetical protein